LEWSGIVLPWANQEATAILVMKPTGAFVHYLISSSTNLLFYRLVEHNLAYLSNKTKKSIISVALPSQITSTIVFTGALKRRSECAFIFDTYSIICIVGNFMNEKQ
jgi:hypothetical protein